MRSWLHRRALWHGMQCRVFAPDSCGRQQVWHRAARVIIALTAALDLGAARCVLVIGARISALALRAAKGCHGD